LQSFIKKFLAVALKLAKYDTGFYFFAAPCTYTAHVISATLFKTVIKELNMCFNTLINKEAV